MTDEKFNPEEMEEDEDVVVVMTDEEGNEFYYREELIVEVCEKRFAVLAPIKVDEEGGCTCECGCEDEDTDVFIARIDVDENGEDVYTDPTDEEFDEVRKAYEELADDEE